MESMALTTGGIVVYEEKDVPDKKEQWEGKKGPEIARTVGRGNKKKDEPFLPKGGSKKTLLLSKEPEKGVTGLTSLVVSCDLFVKRWSNAGCKRFWGG